MVSGLLLTGGRSWRLGADKASLVLDGETLARRMAARLGAVCDPVYEVGPGRTDLPSVTERPAGSGPLAALAAGGSALRAVGMAGAALLVAVDLPRVGIPLLDLLRDWPGSPTAVPESGGLLQPVCARYGPDAMVAAESLVIGGVRSLHALLDVIEYDVVPEVVWRALAPADSFDDVDTPEDAARLGIDVPGLR
jgi:molybdopterin-guanine dinucleotide biosynthesis protein A